MFTLRQLLPLLSILVATICLPLAAAQERTREQQVEVDRLQSGIDDFFKRFNDSAVGPDAAFKTLVGNGPLKENKELAGLIEKANKLDRYGRYTGHDLASVKTVGSDLVI